MDWWEAIETDNDTVLLIYKVAHDGHYRIVMEREVMERMEKQYGKLTSPPYYGFGWISLRRKTLSTMGLDDFLGWCNPRFFGGIPKQKRKLKKLSRSKPKKVLRKLKIRKLRKGE